MSSKRYTLFGIEYKCCEHDFKITRYEYFPAHTEKYMSCQKCGVIRVYWTAHSFKDYRKTAGKYGLVCSREDYLTRLKRMNLKEPKGEENGN